MSECEINIGGGAGGHKIIIQPLSQLCDPVSGKTLTGSWLWRSAIVLSQWMADLPSLLLQGKSVLELGAGAGLPGLTAARLGAARVLLTDLDPLLPGLLNNVRANGLDDRVEVRELTWGSDESLTRILELGGFDIVLMSDVFYDPEEMASLAKTLRAVCGNRTEILAATELRPWTGVCLNELASQGFAVTELANQTNGDPVVAEDGDSTWFAIFQLKLDKDNLKDQNLPNPYIDCKTNSHIYTM